MFEKPYHHIFVFFTTCQRCALNLWFQNWHMRYSGLGYRTLWVRRWLWGGFYCCFHTRMDHISLWLSSRWLSVDTAPPRMPSAEPARLNWERPSILTCYRFLTNRPLLTVWASGVAITSQTRASRRWAVAALVGPEGFFAGEVMTELSLRHWWIRTQRCP